jgi:glycerol-3-phosphate cytidylyltransferase-like family protein
MRIAILTQALRYNYGGILQNYALQTVLRRMGHDVVTLDPRRYRYKWWQYPVLILRHTVTRYIRGYRTVPVLAEWLQDKEIRLLGTNTFKFIDQYISRKEYWIIAEDVKEQDYDAFVVGSDQTWRWEYNRGMTKLTNMFLDFTKGWKVKRIAYAASFGTNEWEGDAGITKICKEAIKDFDLVTVREFSGIDICRDVFGVKAHHVLDPTLLLPKEDYMTLVERKGQLDTKEGELYLYLLDENEENKRLIKEIAETKGMTPYTYHSKVTDGLHPHTIEERIQPPIELWLKGFDQAEIVLTDSFHACVFSIIFRKQFYLYGNIQRGLVRYTSLFNQLGINNRFVRTIDDVNNMEDVNYEVVYEHLKVLQDNSIRLFENALGGKN